MHEATHIAQFQRGAPTTGADAEREALRGQQDALAGVETTTPPGQFWTMINDALTNNTGWLGEWQAPRDPRTP